jgi:hypothetical protein
MNKTVSCSPITAEDRFHPWPVYERFVVNQAALGGVCLRVISLPYHFHTANMQADLHVKTIFQLQVRKD